MRIRFVSPWYPDYAAPHSGIFVAKQVDAVRRAGHDVSVQVPQIFPAPSGPIPRLVTESMKELAEHSIDAMFPTKDGVTSVPSPVPSRGGILGRAAAVASSLSMLEQLSNDKPDLIHAHVGLPVGVAVARTNQKTPLVVTEHWSGLGAALKDPAVAASYAELVRKADAFICVSDYLKQQIVDVVGSWASEEIEVVANIVDLSDITFRRREELGFRSWIYVGGLMQHKGVQSLVRAYGKFVERYDSGARLTLVGDGPLRNWIEMFAASHGLADSIELVGSVDHGRLGIYLERADVMVHLSPVETFGIASLEGIGAGLPVISLRNLGTDGAWGDLEKTFGTLLELDSTPTEVAQAVAALRDSPERLDLTAGRRMIEERFAAEVVANRLVETYKRVHK